MKEGDRIEKVWRNNQIFYDLKYFMIWCYLIWLKCVVAQCSFANIAKKFQIHISEIWAQCVCLSKQILRKLKWALCRINYYKPVQVLSDFNLEKGQDGRLVGGSHSVVELEAAVGREGPFCSWTRSCCREEVTFCSWNWVNGRHHSVDQGLSQWQTALCRSGAWVEIGSTLLCIMGPGMR